MNGNIKKILIAVVVIIALFFVYRLFFSGSAPVPALSVQTGSGGNAQAGKEFLAALLNLQNINLDVGAAVLKDGSFVNLRDMSVSLPDEPQGRPNPFKPIGDDAAISSSASASSSPSAPVPAPKK